MSDVFISYAREDTATAGAFARLLAARGWSVWWDRSIPPGRDYDEVIQEALSAAKCVVVIWSQHSVGSRWVLAEAQEGADREILVPVAVETATIPLGFRRIQIVRLIDWDGASPCPELTQLIDRVADVVRRPATPVTDPAAADATRRRRMSPLLSIAAPTVLAAAIFGTVTLWRTSPRVEVEITATRVAFTIGASTTPVVSVVGPADVTSLRVEKFDTITFEPQSVEIADDDDREPSGSSWKSMPIANRTVALAPGEYRLEPAVTFESTAGPTKTVGRLDVVRAASGSVITLESVPRTHRLLFRLDGPRPRAVLAMPDLVHVFADHARLDGDTRSSPKGSILYRIRLRADTPLVEIAGASDSLVLSFGLPSADAGVLFSGDDISVSALDVTALNDVGARVSAVSADGHITYPDYADIPPVAIHPRDYVGLEPTGQFYLREITTLPTDGAIRLRLEGRAERIATSTGDLMRDRRLTGLDVLWHNPRVALLCAIVVWVIPTTIAVLRLQNESTPH